MGNDERERIHEIKILIMNKLSFRIPSLNTIITERNYLGYKGPIP